MTVANILRGEIALRLGDRELLLRPTFTALVAAEAEIGNLFAVVERAAAGEVRVAEMGALFWHCLADCERSRPEFEDMLVLEGVTSLLLPYRQLLARMFGGA